MQCDMLKIQDGVAISEKLGSYQRNEYYIYFTDSESYAGSKTMSLQCITGLKNVVQPTLVTGHSC